MTSRMEDYSELLKTLDEILQEEHDVEIAASASTIRALLAEREALEAELVEARRRRDAWKAKAKGYDEVRLALRQKVGAPWPPNLSRALWAGIAADERKRADDAEAKVDRLRDALREAIYMLDPEPEDILRGAGIYRIVLAYHLSGGVLSDDLMTLLEEMKEKSDGHKPDGKTYGDQPLADRSAPARGLVRWR